MKIGGFNTSSRSAKKVFTLAILLLSVSVLSNAYNVDKPMENIRKGMFMYCRIYGLQQIVPSDSQSQKTSGVYMGFATEFQYPVESELLRASLDNQDQLIYLGISNENINSIRVPMPENVYIIVHGKSIRAKGIKELPNKFVKTHKNYLGGNMNQNVLSGEYLVFLYAFGTNEVPEKVVIHGWLPNDIVLEKTALFE